MNLANLAGLIFLVLALIAIAAVALAVPTIRPVLKRTLAQPSFLIVCVVLLTAALGLNAAVNFMQLHFKKEAVPVAKPLGTIGEKFGSWVQVSQDQPLDHEMEDVLGTNQYIFRDYVDEKVVGPDVLSKFRDKSITERREILGGIRQKFPTGVISFSVTYYTGMVDTVAHVPDRCVTADGYEPKPGENLTVTWPIARDLPTAAKPNGRDEVEVRYINFEDQTGASNVTRSVSYFFHTNGKFISSPLGVRRELADLFQKKGYYAKIECMTTIPDKDKSAEVTTDFLTAALPEVYKCMPDWNKVTGKDPSAPSAPAEQVAAK